MTKKIEGLQVLRFLGMCMIVLNHLGVPQIAAWGHFGASVFFVLSGFLMKHAYGEKRDCDSLWRSIRFAYRKNRKIYPLYVLTLGACILLWFFGDRSELAQGPYLFKVLCQNLLLIEAWIPQISVINGPTWFLSALLFCYFLFPYTNGISKDKNNAFRDIFIIFSFEFVWMYLLWEASSQYALNSVEFMHYIAYYCPLTRFLEFLVGCNLYHWHQDGGKVNDWMLYVVALLGGIAAVIPQSSEQWWMYGIVYVLPCCSLVELFSTEESVISRLLTNKITIFLGDISPYFFLIHVVVFTYLDAVVHFTLGRYDFAWMPLLRITVGVAISIVLSILYRYFDSKIKNRSKKV